jgi:hypothetical protein
VSRSEGKKKSPVVAAAATVRAKWSGGKRKNGLQPTSFAQVTKHWASFAGATKGLFFLGEAASAGWFCLPFDTKRKKALLG